MTYEFTTIRYEHIKLVEFCDSLWELSGVARRWAAQLLGLLINMARKREGEWVKLSLREIRDRVFGGAKRTWLKVLAFLEKSGLVERVVQSSSGECNPVRTSHFMPNFERIEKLLAKLQNEEVDEQPEPAPEPEPEEAIAQPVAAEPQPEPIPQPKVTEHESKPPETPKPKPYDPFFAGSIRAEMRRLTQEMRRANPVSNFFGADKPWSILAAQVGGTPQEIHAQATEFLVARHNGQKQNPRAYAGAILQRLSDDPASAANNPDWQRFCARLRGEDETPWMSAAEKLQQVQVGVGLNTQGLPIRIRRHKLGE